MTPGAQWWFPAPPAEEPEAAGNMNWEASPAGSATFGGWREDNARTVTFSKSGKYKLQGHSAAWYGIRADRNPIEIVVTP